MADGSVVELPSATSSGESRNRVATQVKGNKEIGLLYVIVTYDIYKEKLDAMSTEYSYLLTTQLESQRSYYQSQLDKVQAEISTVTMQVKALMEEIKNAKLEKEDLEDTKAKLEKESSDAAKEKSKAERRLESTKTKLKDADRALREENEVELLTVLTVIRALTTN